MKLWIYAAIAVGSLFAQNGPGPNQSAPAPKESYTGTAVDSSGKGVANAEAIYKAADGETTSVTADANGKFSASLTAGKEWTLTVTGNGAAAVLAKAPKNAGNVKLEPPMEQVVGFVLGLDKNAVPNAKVSVTTGAQTIVVVTDTKGAFQANVPSNDRYELSAETEGVRPVTVAVAKDGAQSITIVLPVKDGKADGSCGTCAQPSAGAKWTAVIALFLFFLAALFARYHNIIRVDRKILRAHIDSLWQECAALKMEKAQIPQKEPPPPPSAAASVRQRAELLIYAAQGELDAAEKRVGKTFFFGMRGDETAARMELSDVEIILAESFTREQIISRLRIAEEVLRPDYANLADKVAAVLAKADDAATSDAFLRATLIDVMRSGTHRKGQLAAMSVLNWQNKAFMLVVVSVVVLIAMVAALDNPLLLALGFIGGLLSRLLRGKTEDAGDGSLRWTSLFLSPIYGAFAAWSGILLLTALTTLQILGQVFKDIQWNNASCSSLALGLAIVFGFSERFFSAVSEMAENAVTKAKNSTAADDGAARRPASGPAQGIPSSSPSAKSATFKDGLLTITGNNLKSVKKVELKPATGASITLNVQTTSDAEIQAKPASALAQGSYELILDGNGTGTSVNVG